MHFGLGLPTYGVVLIQMIRFLYNEGGQHSLVEVVRQITSFEEKRLVCGVAGACHLPIIQLRYLNLPLELRSWLS